jgi:hypothetical protein
MKRVNREGWVFLSEVASSTDSARMNTNGKYIQQYDVFARK